MNARNTTLAQEEAREVQRLQRLINTGEMAVPLPITMQLPVLEIQIRTVQASDADDGYLRDVLLSLTIVVGLIAIVISTIVVPFLDLMGFGFF